MALIECMGRVDQIGRVGRVALIERMANYMCVYICFMRERGCAAWGGRAQGVGVVRIGGVWVGDGGGVNASRKVRNWGASGSALVRSR